MERMKKANIFRRFTLSGTERKKYPKTACNLYRDIGIGSHSLVGTFYPFRPIRTVCQMNQKEIEESFVSTKILLLIHPPEIGYQAKPIYRPAVLRLLNSASASDSISCKVFFLPLAITSQYQLFLLSKLMMTFTIMSFSSGWLSAIMRVSATSVLFPIRFVPSEWYSMPFLSINHRNRKAAIRLFPSLNE
jgi:hypothetical protein